MVKVLIKKLDPAVKLPEYKTEGASGMDLTAFIKQPLIIKPKTSILVPTGFLLLFQKIMRFKLGLGLVWQQKIILAF